MEGELNKFLEWVADMLADAAASIDEWGTYASDYHKEKWHLKEDVKKFEDASALVRKHIKNEQK